MQRFLWPCSTSLLVIYFLLNSNRPVSAHPLPDNTLGAESSIVTPIGQDFDRIEGGALRGNNLFHSFQRFDIQTGYGAYFSAPNGVANIFSRVTGGGSPSSINGTLGAGGTANLFFINPNGIIFGPGATIDLNGFFIASTASSVLFPNEEKFSATAPRPIPLLTIDSVTPIGLVFEGNPGSIQLQNAHLSTEPATTMALVGGDINIDNSSLTSRLGSRLELGAVKDAAIIGLAINPNEIRLQFPDEAARANISIVNDTSIRSIVKIVNGALDSDEDAGAKLSGQLKLTGHDITVVNHSEIVAENGLFIGPYDLLPVDININTTGRVDLKQSSSIVNASGGYTAIQATQLSLADQSKLTNKIEAQPKYNSINENIGVGDIRLKVEEDIAIKNSVISIEIRTTKADTLGSTGAATPLVPYVQAPYQSLGIPGIDGGLLNGTPANYYSRNQAPTCCARSESVYGIDGSITVPASSGILSISARSLSLSNGAQLRTNSSTQLNQDAIFGNIDVNVKSGVEILGEGSGIFSKVGSSNTVATGNVKVDSSSLSLQNGAQISTTVEGSAGTSNAGNIELRLKQLLLIQNNSKITTSVGKDSGRSASGVSSGILVVRDSRAVSTADGLTSPENNGVSAGNIGIVVPFIVAKGNGDIQANSYYGGGGKVNIDAKTAFGMVKHSREELTKLLNTTSPDELDASRLLTNDVVAISQTDPRLNGQVDISELNADPGRGIDQLPQEPRATDVADSCQVSNGKESVQFFDIGRGGLPPRPEDPLSIDLLEWSPPPETKTSPPDESSRADRPSPDRPSHSFQTSTPSPKLVPPCQSR